MSFIEWSCMQNFEIKNLSLKILTYIKISLKFFHLLFDIFFQFPFIAAH